jgi:hypothetical protein
MVRRRGLHVYVFSSNQVGTVDSSLGGIPLAVG